MNRFALDLYARLRGNRGNLFFSPYSIRTALTMTFIGARGRTAEQMAAVLHLPPDRRYLHHDLEWLKQGGSALHMANALWGEQGCAFRPEFLATTRENYGADVHEAQFGTPEAARQTINAWVEGETRGKIRELISPGMLSVDTRLVLVNAIYFKGQWRNQFTESETADQPFRVNPEENTVVRMMEQTLLTNCLEETGFQALELPYGAGPLSMVVILPRRVDGLEELEGKLNADNLGQWLGRLRKSRHEVELEFPRFSFNMGFELKATLSQMGMPLAFDAHAADLSGMISGNDRMALSDVIHQAYVNVNERGTEAAAATYDSGKIGGAPPPAPRAAFRADHPFVFMILHRRSGDILFVGRVTDPGKTCE